MNFRNSKYKRGYRYCSECVIWFKTKILIRCPFCNQHLRFRSQKYNV